MKVLHCIPGMGGGGAERQLAYLAGPLAACGWEVHVALGTDGPNLDRLTKGGAVLHWLRRSSNYDPRLAWQLASIVRQVRPELVQVWFVQMEVLGGFIATVSRIPWILSERSSVLAYPSTLKNRLRIAMSRTADAIVSNSSAGDAYWAERADGRVARFVIPNVLPLEEIAAACPGLPHGLAIDPGDDVVLFVGRFGPEKNVDVLLTALRQVVARPRTAAIMCGDGPLRSSVERRVGTDGLTDRIFTPGHVNDIWGAMKRAAVTVAVGLFEGRPNAVLEAMAAGCPLVVSDIPAHREILDESHAVFVDARDPGDIADAVLRVLADPGAAAGRALAARARVAAWSTSLGAAEYDRVYRAILAARARAAATPPA